MLKFAIPFCALTLLAAPALADDCAGRMAEVHGASQSRTMYRATITAQNKGQAKTVNTFEYQDEGHYLVTMIEPANQPLLLTWNGTTYQSADGQKWTKAYSFNAEEAQAAGKKMIDEQVASIANATCASETVDGVDYEVLEADMATTSPAMEIHAKYWFDPAKGFVAKAETLTKMSNFESFTTQTWEEAPDLDLPKPE